jgi:tRNA 5-methylaminomethyl-2-thiouridine biosynthesis bifunctional protein
MLEPMLDWQDGQPVSRRFGDVYFSRAGGIEETRHVFLAGNRLPERFAALASGSVFVVGETGFGTGLNFLCAWQLFQRSAPLGARLHFVSTELYPLRTEELDAALRLWPELDAHRQGLMRQYRVPAPGWHRFAFDRGRVHLTLLVGDARHTLNRLQGHADAWFLDGFSPAKNPELWEPALLCTVAERSRAGATAATYSCAAGVRRALAAAGFSARKAAGFGAKREMLCAQLERGGLPRRRPAQRRAAVIGGGLAGSAAADSLAQRGWEVALLERHDGLAAEASGNPQGVLYARLSAHGTPLSRLVQDGYQHTLRMLRARLSCDGEQWSDCPVLQLAFDAQEARRQAALPGLGLPEDMLRVATAEEASALAGVALAHGGLVFAGGGWVHPPALCRELAARPGIELRSRREALRLERGAHGWRVLDAGTCIAEAAVVVVAAGVASASFEHTSHLPLRVNRGQITLLPATRASAALSAVLCGESTAVPARAGLHSTGATFAREAGTQATAGDNAENLAMLARLSPVLYDALGGAELDPARLAGRAGLRCGSPDYLPLVGPLDESAPGLLLSTAHGSRGLITAPLSGEVLAAWLEDEPAPLPADMMQALLPGRFARRR